jgi:hypothetical protein
VAGEQIVKSWEYRGTPQTVVKMFEVADGDRGQRSFKLRDRVEQIIRYVRPKDYWSEVLAIYYWCCGPQFRYTRDPRKVEQIKDPLRMLDEIDRHGSTLVDCDEFSTFLRAAIGSVGGKTRIVTVGFRPKGEKQPNPQLFDDPVFKLMTSPHPRLPGPFTHVFAQALKPGGIWVTIDPVAGPRTPKMQSRVKQYRIYESDD